MSLQDPIADFITIINNAQRRQFKEVVISYSKIKQEISNILKRCGYIENIVVSGEGSKKSLILFLKYYNDQPVIQEFKRVSKLSRRVYVSIDTLPMIKNGFGEAILTTNQGLMTAKEARVRNVGGEVICTVF